MANHASVKDNVFIGANTTILGGITIGADTIIGTGSLVNKNIVGNGVYAGVPVKYIYTHSAYYLTYNVLHHML